MRWLDGITDAINIASEVAQSCLALCDPMGCSPPGSSIHGIFQARVLEWGAVFFSRGSSRPRDQTQVSLIAGWRFTVWATRGEMNMNLGKLWEMVRDREAWRAAIHGVVRSQMRLGDWTMSINNVVMVSGKQRGVSAIQIQVSILPWTPLPSRLPHSTEGSSKCYTWVLVGYPF